MKIIFLNRFFHPDLSATSQMLGGIAFGLARVGYAVTVITSRLRYDQPGSELPARETIDGVEIIRVVTSARGRDTLAGRINDYGTFYAGAVRELSRITEAGDIVVAKTDPPLLSVGVASVARRRNARLVNWLQDVFPETADRLGFGRGMGRLVIAALTRMRDRSLRTADMNVVLGERMQAFIASRGVSPDAIRIIPNWADGQKINPVPKEANSLRREWHLQSGFVVGYSGNLGRAHDVETMLAAIALTEAASAAKPLAADDPANPVVRWLIIGSGSLNSVMKAEVERRGLRSVIFKPYQPAEALALSLSAADAHVVTLKPSLEGLIVPSKFYGIAAAGRPTLFIGDPEGEIGRIVSRNGIGLVVREGDAAALAEAVMGLSLDHARTSAQGGRARALFERDYDLSIALGAWQSMIEQVAARSHRAGTAG